MRNSPSICDRQGRCAGATRPLKGVPSYPSLRCGLLGRSSTIKVRSAAPLLVGIILSPT